MAMIRFILIIVFGEEFVKIKNYQSILLKNINYIPATTTASELNRIVKSTGFWFDWQQKLSQYDHPAQIVGIRKGRIIRIIQRTTISTSLLNQVIYELNGEYLRSYPLPAVNVLFRCFQYDNKNELWKLDWGFLFLFAPIVVTAAITGFIFRNKQKV